MILVISDPKYPLNGAIWDDLPSAALPWCEPPGFSESPGGRESRISMWENFTHFPSNLLKEVIFQVKDLALLVDHCRFSERMGHF